MRDRLQKLLVGFLVITFLIFISGCANIPQEAPELSVELGKRIAAIEESHIALLRRYMDEKRKEVDKFITERWAPEFAENYFKQPNITSVWDEVVKSNNPSDRLKLLTLVGPKLQERINTERLKLIKPLDEIENNIERRFRDEYHQAKVINNSITSFLVSVAEVAENRSRLLEFVGVEDEKIRKAISDADSAVTKLVTSKDDAQKIIEDFKTAIEGVRDVLEK